MFLVLKYISKSLQYFSSKLGNIHYFDVRGGGLEEINAPSGVSGVGESQPPPPFLNTLPSLVWGGV